MFLNTSRERLEVAVIGGIWALFLLLPIQTLDQMPSLCPARWAGGTCLTCGVTHSIHSLARGHVLDAVQFNPAGLIVVIAAARRCITLLTGNKCDALNCSLVDLGLLLSFFSLAAFHYIEWI